MYKVSYYSGAGAAVTFKWFDTLSEAADFSMKCPRESVLEIKLYLDEKKKEDRT
jgi:hypothetical protein